MPRRVQFAGRWRLAWLAPLIVCVAGPATHARDRESGPRPALRIPVDQLGYRPPGKLYLLARYSSSSLDFLDANHLLLTFREPHLMVRKQGSSGLDQVIQADIVELPTGKVVAEDDWLLHDRSRYLWPLAGGKMLLRVDSTLYEVDSNLHLTNLYASPTALEEVETSPDGNLLVMESKLEKHTPEEHARLVNQSAMMGGSPPAEDVQVRMVRLDEKKLVMSGRADAAGDVPTASHGFFEQKQVNDNSWNVVFHAFAKGNTAESETVTKVDSVCEPTEKVLNPQSVLVLSCPRGHNDRFVAAYSLNGEKLWDGRWQSNFTWPAFRVAQGGGAIAISWLAVNRPVSAREPINDDEVQNQVLSVLDSRSGSLRIAMLLKPIVSAGGNFALSPDGKRLAVVNGGAIEVYNLPEPAPPATEQASK